MEKPTNKFKEDALLFEDGETILAREECQQLVLKIRQTVEVTEQYFDDYFLPVLVNAAHYCQSLPASAGHHHAHPYGLIKHLLEVTLYAVRASRQYLYNCTDKEGMIDELKHIYVYAVLVSAAMHDLAKVVTDVRFKVRSDPNKKFVPWTPLSSYPPPESAQIEYKVDRKVTKSQSNIYHYNTHSIMASSLLSRVVPKKGLQWIVETHPGLETDLYHALSGDYDNAGVIGQSVRQGDEVSTELGRTNVHALSNPSDPIFKMKEMITNVLTQPQSFNLKVNQLGFVSIVRIGDLVYVSGKALQDTLRSLFQKSNMNFPEKDHVFEQMISNNFTVNSPSGDTMWWVKFTKHGVAPDETKADIKCFVFKAEDFIPNDEIKSCDFDIHLSDKSLPKEQADAKNLDEAKEDLSRIGFVFHDTSAEKAKTDSDGETKNPVAQDDGQTVPQAAKKESKSSTTNPSPTRPNSQSKKAKAQQREAVLALLGESSKKENSKENSEPASPDEPKASEPSESASKPATSTKGSKGNDASQPSTVDSKSSDDKSKKSTKRDQVTKAQPSSAGQGDQLPEPKKVKRRSGLNLSMDSSVDVQVSKTHVEPVAEQSDITPTHSIPDKQDQAVINQLESEMSPSDSATDNELHGSELLNSLLEEEVAEFDPQTLLPDEPTIDDIQEHFQVYEEESNQYRFVRTKPNWADCKGLTLSQVNEHMQLFGFIQQGIDSKAIRFNGNSSWLHFVEGGIFIASPKAFTHEGSPFTNSAKFSKMVKNSGLLATSMFSTAGDNLVTGAVVRKDKSVATMLNGHYLLVGQLFKFTYQGKPIGDSRCFHIDSDTVQGRLPKLQ
ncbi:TraI domain-containing protein [Vibrio agarivorans]|uniref:TraI domain-containing protein n=1 Tax=Vibrio agarivorans TaxID=153622 RepID=A0ABT7Y701_9VIBR|nr:TraI domain-containing protein [Vibrio agarivorans]